MTLEQWLERRTPVAPLTLRERVRLLVASPPTSAAVPADDLIDLATSQLSRVLAQGCRTRESALDLLAVDALVTYAFEAASEDPARLGERAQRAMARISRVASEGPRARD
jgi:hypothetical protein